MYAQVCARRDEKRIMPIIVSIAINTDHEQGLGTKTKRKKNWRKSAEGKDDMSKETYYIQIGEDDSDIIQGIALTDEERDGVIKVLMALRETNGTTVDITDSLGHDYLN